MLRIGVSLFAFIVVVPVRADESFRPDVSTPTLDASLRTQWYGVHVGGKKIGNYKTAARRTDEGILDASIMRMLIVAQGKQTEMEIHKRVWYAAAKPHVMLRAEEECITPQGREKAVLAPRQGKWVLEVTAGTRRFEKECGLLDYAYADSLAAEAWIRNKPAVGARVTYRSLSVAEGNVTSESLRVVAVKGEGAARVYDVEVDGGAGKVPVRARYDAEGIVLVGSAGPLEMHREVEAEAKKIAHGDDLFQFGFVRVDAPLGALDPTRVLAMEVVGVDSAAFAVGPHQKVVEGARLILGKGKGTREKVTPEASARALEENIDFPIRDERVRKLSALAVGAETDDHAKAALLLGFVHGYMRSENTAENPDIDVLLATRKGDCKGHARLFAVLARSVNLPTREVTGLAYMGDAERAFAGHRWNEVALGGVWMPMDATIAAYDAAVTHINVTNLNLILGKASFKLVEAQ